MTDNIKKLSDYAHLRKRPEMYLGSVDPHTQTIVLYDDKMTPYVEDITWVPALFTCFREIVDNALDEIVGHGHGNRIDITYDEEKLLFSVQDNGRGIPITFDKQENQYLATMVLTEPRAGRNFDERGEVAGVNGIGSAAVSNTSEVFEVEIIRDGKKFKQTFREGLDGKSLDITTPKITSTKSERTGTYISFHPSKEVYLHRILPERFVKSRAIEIAICNPLLKIFYNGEQLKVKQRPEQTLFPNVKPIAFDIHEGKLRSKFWITFGEGSEHVHSVVNSIPMFNGGVHVDAFRRLFYSGMLTALERESKRRKLTPNRSDIQDGLLIYNITNMQAPKFDSQSKTRLINDEFATIMKRHLESPDLYKDLIRKNPEWISAIYQRCEDRTKKKDASELAKLNKASKRQKVEKLSDATGNDRQKCILFLAEGDSACSSLTEARNPQLHGSLPLKGKVLNVHPSNASLKEAATNAELVQISRSLGLFIGSPAERKKLRYGKVYITCDADEDGKNIMALLVNFFYTFWPELFDAKDPFLYVFDTPLIVASKGKQRQYWFNDNYAEFDQKDYSGWEVTRAKGLAALVKPDWVTMMSDPRVTPITDDGELKEALDLLFNKKRADDRKDWMGV